MSQNSTIFLTGSSGFVGASLLEKLMGIGVNVKLGLRDISVPNLTCETVQLDLAKEICIDLKNVDVLVHLAGVAHRPSASQESYDLINHKATLLLAKTASDQGVKRFIFLSSIGVNGNTSSVSKPFTSKSVPAPHNDYARSKYDAELGLRELGRVSSMEIVIIRPPLIYGNSAPGNFSKLVRLVQFGLPLPLSALENKRSFIGITNMCSFICKVIDLNLTKLGKCEIFLVSDREVISTAKLISAIGKSRGKSVFNIPFSFKFISFILTFLKLDNIKVSLLGDLVIDSSYARQTVDWDPNLTVIQELNNHI